MADQEAREAVYDMDDPHATGEDFVRFCERKNLLTPWQGRKIFKGDTHGYILGARMRQLVTEPSYFRPDDPQLDVITRGGRKQQTSVSARDLTFRNNYPLTNGP